MDESHRLKVMPEGYDPELFNQLYKETKDLRHKLAFEIDSRKFGVDYKEVLSWFDVKFLYTFTRYYGNERLKGYIISALQTFKMRIVKNSYQNKYAVHNVVDINEMYDLAIEEDEPESDSTLLERVRKYFKDRLSYEAYLLWDLELNPPPYIMHRLPEKPKNRVLRIPEELIVEYLGLEEHDKARQLLTGWRKDIRAITSQAKEYFQFKVFKL